MKNLHTVKSIKSNFLNQNSFRFCNKVNQEKNKPDEIVDTKQDDKTKEEEVKKEEEQENDGNERKEDSTGKIT